MNTQNAEQIMKRGSTLDKPKKTPRVRVIMSAKELSPNWADHEVHSNYRRPRIKFSDARPTSQESENDSDEERDCDEIVYSEAEESETSCLGGLLMSTDNPFTLRQTEETGSFLLPAEECTSLA